MYVYVYVCMCLCVYVYVGTMCTCVGMSIFKCMCRNFVYVCMHACGDYV